MTNKFERSNLLFLFILIFTTCCSCVDKNETTLNEIFIECDPSEFNSIYKNYKENNYISVKITYKGKTWENVKMRIRGDSSRKLDKKSLKLKFSKKDPFINNATKLNLNAEWYDKTYMTQYLSSYLMRKNNVPCFKSEHAFVYLNGEKHGVFLIIQNIDNKFLTSNNLNGNGNLYKATKDGACFNDTSEVYYLWEKKTNKKDLSREDLKQFIHELSSVSCKESFDLYQQKFDYDKLITQVALNILIGNKSTYYHNYYMFHDVEKNKWNMLPWDMDKTLTKNLLDLHYTRSTWCEGSNSNLSDNPIPEFIFVNEPMKKDLTNKLNQLISTTFNKTHLFPIIDSLSLVLDSFIELDTTDNIKDKKEWEKTIVELKSFIEERPKVIFNQIENFPSSFLVNKAKDLTISWGSAHSKTPVSYQLFLCKDIDFKKDSVYTFKTEKTEVEVMGLVDGEYYYFVNATNAKGTTPGFRIKQRITIK